MKFLLAALALILLAGGRSLLSAFNIKPGVYGELQEIMNPALEAVQVIWEAHGLGAPTITSIEDGEHMPGSKHYEGLAFDIRLNDIPDRLHATLRESIVGLLNDNYDVLHEYHQTERDHLHIEYDPS